VSGDFIWRDAGRDVVFRKGGLDAALPLLRENGFAPFELLSTPRALAGAGELAVAAEEVHEVDPGGVPEAAAALLDKVRSQRLVALGGGRTIDAAKAVAAVTGARVAAIPTTMSGAEMTGIHRLPKGAEDRVSGLVRPALVIADPELMTSQPEAELRMSSMNALAHGADSLYTPYANPVSQMTALQGAGAIAKSLDQDPESRDRGMLALGSVLSGYAIDSGMFALHHVICQTLVRVCGTPHAPTNAAILPKAMAFMVPRAPNHLIALAAVLETDTDHIELRIQAMGGNPPGLGSAGADETKLDEAIEAILNRTELSFTPSPPNGEELRKLIESAW
jgi:alcohol dehydrogenase class IV